jgi:hypothetical protein
MNRRISRVVEAGASSRGIRLGCLILLLICSVIPLMAQEDKEEEKDKGETFTGNVVNIEGSIRCQKPEPGYTIEVPDRPGHALTLAHRKCSWTAPWTIAGAKPKSGVAVNFAEKMEGVLHVHGFQVDTLDTGDQLTLRTMGQIPAEKGPVKTTGRWSFMRGTGKFKGIRGGGTYEGKLESDETLTLKLEGVYVPAEMPAGQEQKK